MTHFSVYQLRCVFFRRWGLHRHLLFFDLLKLFSQLIIFHLQVGQLKLLNVLDILLLSKRFL